MACVPSVVVPFLLWLDQPRYAEWLERREAGIHVRHDARSAADFEEAIERAVTDGRLKAGAAALAAELRADGGVEQAVDAISAYMGRLGDACTGTPAPAVERSHRSGEAPAAPAARHPASLDQVLWLVHQAADPSIGADSPLESLNSLELVELHAHLEQLSSVALSPTLTVEARTPRDLAERLAQLAVSVPASGAPGSLQLPQAVPTDGHVSQAAPTGGHVRCLFLHGEATNAEFARHWLDASGWIGVAARHGVELVCIDGPLPSRDRPELWPTFARDLPMLRGRARSWGYVQKQTAACVVVEHVERMLRTHAPIHGIGGFSMGALVAAAVASQTSSVRFFLNICGTPWEWLSPVMRERPMLSVPSLHMVSPEADELLDCGKALSLTRRCEAPVIVRHAHGHSVPMLRGEMRDQVASFMAVAARVATAGPPRMAGPASRGEESRLGGSLGTRWGGTGGSRQSDAFVWRRLIERIGESTLVG